MPAVDKLLSMAGGLAVLLLAWPLLHTLWTHLQQRPVQSSAGEVLWPAVAAPVAKEVEHVVLQHGEKRTDQYAWLRDPRWALVLEAGPAALGDDIRQHLQAEQRYYKEVMSRVAPRRLQQQLLKELTGRQAATGPALPWKDGPWQYGDTLTKGRVLYYRTPAGQDKPREVVLDLGLEALRHGYFHLAYTRHSPDHRLVVYGVDTQGAEFYTLRMVEIATQEEQALDVIPRTNGYAVWLQDSNSFLYVEKDDAGRPKRVKAHVLGTDP
eukprot:g1205.t1